jgi:hypothetical protein
VAWNATESRLKPADAKFLPPLQRNVFDTPSVLHPNRHCGVENGLPERQGFLPYLQTMIVKTGMLGVIVNTEISRTTKNKPANCDQKKVL